ncbi:MAG: carboxypeptidase-like regulatory domain-containing protein [Bryobacterales bacterium]|nr:carboxypeptidase-like regulatory domain-containing protein [Bryobacteraceae bacterium]MDW8353598.1 carboxypeptidase-like regulatory domain-containing protein [Bryobacterales bacterium]
MKVLYRVPLLLLVASATLFSQALTSLSGLVTDPTGAIVPAASVILENLDTQARRETVSDSTGRYLFAQVQPGNYRIRVKKEGFREAVVEDVRLLVNQPATLDVRLELGAVAETVSVSATGVQVNTTDASLGNVITYESIVQLPSFARNVAGLLSLQPGVTFTGDSFDYRSGAVNGGKSDQSNLTLDGIDINNQQERYSLVGVLRVTPDSIQEFRSTTLNAGAEHGRTSGAQVQMVTRSGTNELHGALYDYHRNTKTAANSFFNNLSGVRRPALLIDVFGAAVGGPIRKNRFFFFANYEGRRDRSAEEVLRIVPSRELRQGIVQYNTLAGGVARLTPEDLRRIDPAGIGVNAKVLELFRTYPEPNDFTQGDQLNRVGYRFTAPRKTKEDTYISRLDFILSSGHNLFWRGNLQNDHAAGVPQFPGDPPRSVTLSNNKGMAVGYNAVFRPNLVGTFRWGLTRQGLETTGIQNRSAISFRGFDDRYAPTRNSTRIIPTYHVTQDFSWIRGSHNIQFGAVQRFIRNRRSNTLSSFHAGTANVSWLRGTGIEFQRAVPDIDPRFGTAYRDAVMAVLGIVSQVTANYNYDIQGNVLPEGAPVKRRFHGEEYEMYLQDTWRVSRGLTVTAGLRYSLFPPVYEADGIQTSAVPALGKWFDMRGALAAQGRSQAEAGNIKWVARNSPEGRPLYPYHKKNFAPRVSLAYSPQSNEGWRRWLFGGPGKTAIRAGFGMFYDLFGQGVMRLVSDNVYGFKATIRNRSGVQTALTAPRFTGLYDLPRDLLPPPPKGGFPIEAPFLDIHYGLDDGLQPPYSMTMNFSIGRELAGGWFVEGSYVGRLSRKSLMQRDLAMPTNLRDPASGMTYFQAATELVKLRRAGTPTSQVRPIAFWENFFPGARTATLSATQAIYEVFKIYPNDEISALYDLDYLCDPTCSRLGPNAFFSSQYSAMAAWSSIAGGNYHAMQWTVRKRFAEGGWVNLNYTFSKSIDLASVPERADGYSGFAINSWEPWLRKAVSDYDTTHLFNIAAVYELPFGKGRRFLSGASGALDALLGGWQISGIWRQSSGFPTSVGTGRVWPTNWNITSFATRSKPVPETKTTKNAPAIAGRGGPNVWPDPRRAIESFDFTFPGGVGDRNVVRGDGMFVIDLGLAKRFRMPYSERHSIQFRAEAFNVGNNVRFEPQTANISLGDVGSFGKYTSLLVGPRQIQFALRYEF